MTRRPLTVRELQKCFAPGDVHLIDDGVSFMVEYKNDAPNEAGNRQVDYYKKALAAQQNERLPDWARTVHLIDDGASFMVDDGRDPRTGEFTGGPWPGRCSVSLPDWARTVQELPRRRRTCGRLCILATAFAWIVLFACGGALLVAAAGVALEAIR